MAFPLNLLMMKLFIDYPDLGDADSCTFPDAPVAGVNLLPHSHTELALDCLYVCNNCRLASSVAAPGLMLLCVGDKPPEELQGNGVICLDTDRDFAELFNKLSEILHGFRSWEHRLDISMSNGGSLRDLLNLSSDIFRGTVGIYDPTFKLMAAISNADTDAVICLVEQRGFFPVSYINKSMGESFMKNLLQKGSIQYEKSDTREMVDWRALFIDGHVVAYCVLPMQQVEHFCFYSAMFGILCEKIKSWFSRGHLEFIAKKYLHEFLFADLLNERQLSEEEVFSRSAHIGLESDANFVLLRPGFVNGEHGSFEYFTALITNVLESARIFTYRECIYVLLPLPREGSTQSVVAKKLTVLRPHIAERGLTFGVSLVFSPISEIKTARLQADAAFQLSKKPSDLSRDSVFSFYGENGFYHMLMMCSSLLPLESLCSTKLLAVQEDDRKHGTKYLRLISVYLEEKCEITATADRLHLHRNTVIYHLGRLQEKYGIDLDNPEQRFSIEVSLKILEYIKGSSL